MRRAQDAFFEPDAFFDDKQRLRCALAGGISDVTCGTATYDGSVCYPSPSFAPPSAAFMVFRKVPRNRTMTKNLCRLLVRESVKADSGAVGGASRVQTFFSVCGDALIKLLSPYSRVNRPFFANALKVWQ